VFACKGSSLLGLSSVRWKKRERECVCVKRPWLRGFIGSFRAVFLGGFGKHLFYATHECMVSCHLHWEYWKNCD